MGFTYQIQGTLQLKGCNGASQSIVVPFRYAEGSVVYLCKKAKKGILEAISIKKVLLNAPPYYIPIYVDTLNACYNERELCTQSEAILSAKAYYQNLLTEIDVTIDQICEGGVSPPPPSPPVPTGCE